MLKNVLHAYDNRWYLTSYFRNSSKNDASREVWTMSNTYQRSFNRISLRVHRCSSFHIIFAAQQQAHLGHGQSNELPPRSNLGEVVAIPGLASIQTSHWHQPIYHNLFHYIPLFQVQKSLLSWEVDAQNYMVSGNSMKLSYEDIASYLRWWENVFSIFSQGLYVRGKWNVHTSATSEEFSQTRSHGSNRNQIDILWTLMEWLLYQKDHLLERACQFFYNTMASCPHSHICYCFYRHISKLLQFEGFNSLSCFG